MQKSPLFGGGYILAATICSFLFLTQCQLDKTPELEVAAYSCTSAGNTLQLDCPAAPNTNLSAQPDFDYFAWNTFIALNWPALVPSPTQANPRGIPDLSKSFLQASNDDVTVWETFKEKREIFNVDQTTTTQLSPWNDAPDYGPIPDNDDPIMSLFPGQQPGSTTAPTGQYIWNTLDETEEVNGESLETPNVFPYGLVVNPRVWKGDPSEGNPVVYEVKVNYDFYDYVNSNKFFIQDSAIVQAQKAGIRLPYRTSSSSGPGGNNTDRVLNYSVDSTLSSIEKAQTNSGALPAKIGAVHLKAAWIRLFHGDDASQYHTTTAEYYVTVEGETKAQKRYATFGLVGLHIIQRVHTSSNSPVGGAFIFASWEHTSVTSGYTYSNYVQPNQGQTNDYGWYPHVDTPAVSIGFAKQYINPSGLAVQRRYPILQNTVDVNNDVHDQIRQSNPNSVWLNYQLIGTQFTAVNSLPDGSTATNINDPNGIGQPQYMANLVIETSVGLQYFQGQPPATIPIKNYRSTLNANRNQIAFARNNHNMIFGGTSYNMGGCMGCHGVAQSEGYSFSFVLLAGNMGAGVDTQEKFDFTPPKVDTTLAAANITNALQMQKVK